MRFPIDYENFKLLYCYEINEDLFDQLFGMFGKYKWFRNKCIGCYFDNEYTYQEVICNQICHNYNLNVMRWY